MEPTQQDADVYLLGISCFYHDSAAVLLKNGIIIAAAQEERFTRIKHDESLPKKAVAYCLKEAGISINDVESIIFYDKPLLKFERIVYSYIHTWPKGLSSFLKAIPLWLKEKLWTKQTIQKELCYNGKILFSEHHYSHAASAYYPSPFDEATVVTVDGVGEWETTTIGYGTGSDLHITEAIHFPDSLGLLYSAVTYYLGFKVNSAEYKVMGLAPYGNAKIYEQPVRRLIQIFDDGSFHLNSKYFAYGYGLHMTSHSFHQLFGGPPRSPTAPLTQKEKDIAASVQLVLEEALLKLVNHAYHVHPSENLCLSGGVALNCVANEKILKQSPFKHLFIQPASGDAGGALGAALYTWHTILKHPKRMELTHVYFGPSYSDEEIEQALKESGLVFTKRDEEDALKETAKRLSENHVIGWFQGRMEFGPRALGNRSILADARRKENWQRVNLKIKFRESFRPFAPSVLENRSSDYFDLDCPSPYMLLTAPVKSSTLPAVTHVDGSARLQTVNRRQNQKYYRLIEEFGRLTGCPVLINTSFNVRGEPIVCSPQNAIECFLHTDMDDLIIGSYIVSKKENDRTVNQKKQQAYLEQFELD